MTKPIKIKPSEVGNLHRALHIPEHEKIPLARLEAAKKGVSPEMKKKIIFAENARKWN